MKNTLFLLTFSTLIFSLYANTYHDNYYTGFIDTLGFDTHVTEDGVDCTRPASKAVYQFRNTLLNAHKDQEACLNAVVDIIDRLKFEISPLCKAFFGDFQEYMAAYYGDIEEIRSTAERVYKYHHKQIDAAIVGSLEALNVGDDYEAGTAHAHILRQFIDLERTELSFSTIAQNVQEAVEHGSGDLIRLVKKKIEQVKEIVISIELSDVEEFEEGYVQVVTQQLSVPELEQDMECDVYEVEDQDQDQEEIYEDEAQQQVADESFAQQINYDFDGSDGFEEFEQDETEYCLEEEVGEVEDVIVMNLVDQDATILGVFVDIRSYTEDGHAMNTEPIDELVVVNVYLEEDEEINNDEKSFTGQSDSSTLQFGEETEKNSVDDEIEGGDNYVSDYDYDYEIQIIQRRMLSEMQQGFESDYDL